MKGGALVFFAKAQPSRFLAAGVFGSVRAGSHMLTEERQELLGTTALVTLQVTNHDEFARRLASGQFEIGQPIAIVGQPGQLGKQRDAQSGGDELFQGGDLGAPEADAGLKLLVAEKDPNLGRQRAGIAKRNERLIRQILDADFRTRCDRVLSADDQQQWLDEQGFNRKSVLLHW